MTGKIIGTVTVALVAGTLAAVTGVAIWGFAEGLKAEKKPNAVDLITKERLG